MPHLFHESAPRLLGMTATQTGYDDTIPLQRDVSASRQDLARELTDLCKEIIRNYESSNNLVKTIIQKSFKYSNALEAVEDQFALQDQLSES